MNKITKEDIRVRYKEYNRLYFGNQLKHCKFSVQKMSWLSEPSTASGEDFSDMAAYSGDNAND